MKLALTKHSTTTKSPTMECEDGGGPTTSTATASTSSTPPVDGAANDDSGSTNYYRLNNGRVYQYIYHYQHRRNSPSITLLEFLCTTSSANFSEAAWKRRIQRGQVSVDSHGVVTHPNFPMVPTTTMTAISENSRSSKNSKNKIIPMVVCYHRPPWREPVVEVLSSASSVNAANHVIPDSNQLHILYQDDHIMAVHKPSGLPTMHSQTFYEYTVLNALRRRQHHCTNVASSPPQPVHRLGVGTSGVVLIALSGIARQHLSHAIRDKRVTKIYRALVTNANTLLVGENDNEILRIDCPIGPVPYPIGDGSAGGTIHAACPNDGTTSTTAKAKESLSLVRVVRRCTKSNQAVVEVELPTGRPHQIRIHMAYAGHPLVGDPLYLKGGIPDDTPRWFLKPSKEDEDMDTDDEDDDEEDCCTNTKEGLVKRVALPRDCGYSLHAHRITVQHPTLLNDAGTGKKWMTFADPPPAHLA